MDKNAKRFAKTSAMVLGFSLTCSSAIYAAKAIDLSQQPVSVLKQFSLTPAASAVKNELKINEVNRMRAKTKTHIRIQQTYAGYPIFGADAVVHVNGNVSHPLMNVLQANAQQTTTMDGTVYSNIAEDLGNVSPQTLAAKRAGVIQAAVKAYQQKVNAKPTISNEQTELMVYVDDTNKAHWVYKVSFDAAPVKAHQIPAKPVYLIDALTSQVYEQWDNIRTIKHDEPDTDGGGFGGNEKMGKFVYDGLTDHLPKLNMHRDVATGMCTLENKDVTVKHYSDGHIMSFSCAQVDSEHNNVYWWGDQDAVNGGYSPSDDALFGGAVIKDMYQKWYGVPVLTEGGEPMMLTMVVHDPIDNAYWDGSKMTFGDGIDDFYPLTSLGVAAHEISHGFTEQHSNLNYSGQSGGMNEAFSDIAAQAAEFYAYGKNSWQIGPEIFKAENEALRYMDMPSKDCHGSAPGNWCSIDSADQYFNGIDVHFSSGVYNRFFYLLGTTEGWNTKKAFDVMVKANTDYWTSKTNFKKGACGVISAAKELNEAAGDQTYDIQAIKDAFAVVKVDTSGCK